ncbi:MAG: hypothetical protein ABIR39_19800 [Nocardioides sp.]|uniref:hypothetical protein n=1 Tax=Nocardioides sp. TaxID=35761 RepID=UPI00326777DC
MQQHKVYRSTTEKLNEAFARIEVEGDEVVPPLYWLGGRDWLVLFRTPAPSVSAQVED